MSGDGQGPGRMFRIELPETFHPDLVTASGQLALRKIVGPAGNQPITTMNAEPEAAAGH